MNHRLPSLIAVAALITAAGQLVPASAQEKKELRPAAPADTEEVAPSGGGAFHRIDDYVELLKLTPDQKAKIKPILDEETKQRQALRTQKLPRNEYRDKFKALRDATYDKIKPLLTPQQVAQWDRLRSFKPSLPPPGGGAPTNAAPVPSGPPPPKK